MGSKDFLELQIPGYEMRHQIGEGGMAQVYLAIQESLQRKVALKIMSPVLAADSAFSSTFLKEARTIAQLTHPNIVSIYDVGRAHFHHYIAMEYLEGGDLKTALAQGLEEAKILLVIKQIALALLHAHRKGFLHRDIKPENIMFRQDGTAVLTDFGIARNIKGNARLTGTNTIICTPQYISPEYALGKRIDGRSDLYSLGVVFYEAITGKLPFQADEPFAIAYAHVHSPVPRLDPALSRYQPLIDRILAKDPDERHKHPDDLIQDIEILLTGQELPNLIPLPIENDKTANAKYQSPDKTSGLEHEKTIKWLVGGGLCLLLVIIAFYMLHTKNRGQLGTEFSKTAVKPLQAAHKTGQLKTLQQGKAILSLETVPKQVQVFLDNHLLGTAPGTWTDLPEGKHILRLERRYYNPLQTITLLESNKVRKEKLTLKRGTGAITIVSTPENSIIFLDNIQQNKLTPATFEDIGAGKHEIILHHDRYHDLKRTVEVKPGQTAFLKVNLQGGDLVLYNGQWLPPLKAAKRKAQAIRLLLAKAQDQYTRRHYMLPPGDNAYETYFQILALKPDNSQALQGLKQLATIYLQMSRQALKQQKLVKAKLFWIRAARCGTSPKELHRVQETLITQEKKHLAAALTDLQTGEFHKAVTLLHKLTAINPDQSALKTRLKEAKRLHRLAGDFVPVKGGCFQMGCGPWADNCDPDERPAHQVCIRDFSIGKFEITQGQWKAVMGNNPSRFKKGDNYPVENVSWNNIQTFIKKLNQLTGKKFRLPIEAEWEYAARNRGKNDCYAGGNTPNNVAWYKDNSGGSTHPVGTKTPNGLGIYDMSGNVWEWCQDWYAADYYQQSPKNNPNGPAAGSTRVGRGGSWNYKANNIRTTFRDRAWSGVRNGIVGFRLVLTRE